MKTVNTYQVTYTRAIGDINTIIVKARNENEAINNAKYNCFTGSNFREAKIVDVTYSTPRNNGFQGSERA